MARNDETARVLLALMESAPVDGLWNVALERMTRVRAELIVLFFEENHWHRAASLPFTREISRLSGANINFTLKRARQIHEDSIEQARRLVNELAADAKLPLAFEVLGESDREKVRDLVSGSDVVLIAPANIIQWSVYKELEKLDCRIELVETPERPGRTPPAIRNRDKSAREF